MITKRATYRHRTSGPTSDVELIIYDLNIYPPNEIKLETRFGGELFFDLVDSTEGTQ